MMTYEELLRNSDIRVFENNTSLFVYPLNQGPGEEEVWEVNKNTKNVEYISSIPFGGPRYADCVEVSKDRLKELQ